VADLQQKDFITRAVLDIETMSWESVERTPYSGPWELCDRAAQSQAKSAANTAAGVAGTEESAATNERAALTPFYRREMGAEHGFDPTQTQELLNYAGAGTGGSGATATGEANSQAARTRNTSGFSSALDQNARDRGKEMATVNAGVGAEDVMGAKALNQEGSRGMAGLYDTDTSAMLKSMGQVAPDINAESEAGRQGWFQNTVAAINALKPGMSAGGGGTSFSMG
jgi:hypothetical protein